MKPKFSIEPKYREGEDEERELRNQHGTTDLGISDAPYYNVIKFR